MKRLLIIISTVSFMFADSPVGNWKLFGLTVDYFDIARADATVALSDSYGFGITVPVATIPAGLVFNHTPRGPWGDLDLQAAGVNLNVNLYPDGTGVVGEGSYYPDIDLIPGTCITSGQIFPITDSFNWETDEGQDGNMFPYVNILGIPSSNADAGALAYGLGVNGSGVFDNWGSGSVHIPTPSVLPGIFTADGTVLSYPAAYGGVTAGTWGGYYRQEPAMQASNMPSNNGAPIDFILEWNAIDGPESESGLGDDLDVDEDGDGTEFDRVFGLPYISATYVNNTNPLCDITTGALTGAGPGLNYPVAGDIVDALGGEAAVGALITGLCLEGTAASVDAMCQAAGGPTEFVYGSCLDGVEDAVEGQCLGADLDGDGVGTPVEAVTGLCFDASQSDDFAAACDYYGAANALIATCLQLGFDEETCAAAGEQGIGGVEAYCLYATGGYTCEQAGISQCSVLTNPDFAFGLCGTLAASLTESETCDEWAASFDDDFLNEQAAAVLGATCTDYAAATTGLPWGAPEYCGAFAEGAADEAFAVQTGLTCTEYGASYVGMCVESVGFANDMYLMDPSLENWGMFLTYNAASVQQYQAAGYDLATIAYYFPELFVNDSTHDFDPSCYYTGEACSGRLVMNFAPLCIPEVEAHQIVAEFVDLSQLDCDGTGDVAGGFDDLNGDGVWDEEYEGASGDGVVNVVDVIRLIAHILGDNPLGGWLLCEADVTGDGVINVVDVVAMVNLILGGNGLGSDDATEATIVDNGTSVSIMTDGYVGGIDMIVEFNGQFDIALDDKFIGDVSISENTAHILLVGLNKDDLNRENIEGTIFDYTGDILSISQEVANSREMIDNVTFSDGMPSGYEISSAYPNPFNPSTSFEMRLYEASNLTVKVYNLTGQLVDVIAEGNFTADTHTFTWNAENLASGVYFISTQIGSNVENQKVMLIK